MSQAAKSIRQLALAGFVLLIGGGLAYQCATSSTPTDERLAAAEAAVLREIGEAPDELREVRGLREYAVCGSAGSERFIYRPESTSGLLMRETQFAAPMFEEIHKNWCEGSPPAP